MDGWKLHIVSAYRKIQGYCHSTFYISLIDCVILAVRLVNVSEESDH